MWMLIPVKTFGAAKQRLSGVLSARERQRLASALFIDLLERLAGVRGIDGIVVVTRETKAASVARFIDAVVVDDPTEGGQSVAVARGAAFLKGQGVTAFVTIPGDLPLVRAADIEVLVETHQQDRGVTLAPARDRYGTNGLVLSPPDGMTFRFGPDSFKRHLDEARRAGMQVRVVERAGLDLDIDTPEDLVELLRRGSLGRVAELLGDIECIARAAGQAAQAPAPAAQP